MESGKASFSKKGILKTEAEKYSSILNEKPTTSIDFTKPEAMKTKPTKIRKILFNMFLNKLRFRRLIFFKKLN